MIGVNLIPEQGFNELSRVRLNPGVLDVGLANLVRVVSLIMAKDSRGIGVGFDDKCTGAAVRELRVQIQSAL